MLSEINVIDSLIHFFDWLIDRLIVLMIDWLTVCRIISPQCHRHHPCIRDFHWLIWLLSASTLHSFSSVCCHHRWCDMLSNSSVVMQSQMKIRILWWLITYSVVAWLLSQMISYCLVLACHQCISTHGTDTAYMRLWFYLFLLIALSSRNVIRYADLWTQPTDRHCFSHSTASWTVAAALLASVSGCAVIDLSLFR